jgi:hypothetical protein
MTFGEMGYGDPPGESLEGIPFIFLFRKLLRESDTLNDAKIIINNALRTCSYVYMITDAKIENDYTNALLFVTDRNRVNIYGENTSLVDERDNEESPPIDDVVYGGAKMEESYKVISEYYGKISPKVLIEISKVISLKGNMQNVIFKPKALEAWVSNASNNTRDEKGKACNQHWFYFDFRKALTK